jgi:glycosyltransferase involved in cell wall biosynthesis
MRILYVHNINNVAKTYASELSQRGHTIALYEPDLRGGNATLPLKLAMMPRRLLDMSHMMASFSSEYFDLAHIHWASYGILGVPSNIPFIVHCHGSDVRHRLAHPFFRPLLTTIFQRASAVLCITPDILPIVHTIRSDALFSPAPMNTELFAPLEMSQCAFSHQWTILLFTRLDPEKGPEIAVDGITHFTQRHSNIRVRLLDWGILKDKYKACYSKHFEFVPPVPQNLVPHLIQSADVVIGQLASGAIGLAELQAMSCAKPVISSFRYEKAYPVPPPLCQAATAAEVDAHLESLFQHPGIGVELGQNARAWVKTYHSSLLLAKTLEGIYNSVLKKQDRQDIHIQEVKNEVKG